MRRIEYDIFISHSSSDNAFADRLNDLLVKSGFKVWYDNESLVAGTDLRLEIAKKIENSEFVIVVWSNNSEKTDWIKEDVDHAIKNGKTILPICLGDCKPDGFLDGIKWIKCANGELTSDCFFLILSAIYGSSDNIEYDKDVYVSHSWSKDREIIEKIFSRLQLYRLIGDYPNQETVNETRIKKIMGTCRGFIGILTYRGENQYRNTSKYFLEEIRWAEDSGLPGILIADSRVNTDNLSHYPVYAYNIDKWENADKIKELESFIEDNLSLNEPRTPHIFFARSLNRERDRINLLIKKLCGSVTAIPCKDGYDLGQGIQQAIIDRIKKAYIMIADISGDRFNTYIETGIALGADVELFLVKQGDPKTPQFMYRNNEIKFYDDDCELLAVVHNELRKHRRKVLN